MIFSILLVCDILKRFTCCDNLNNHNRLGYKFTVHNDLFIEEKCRHHFSDKIDGIHDESWMESFGTFKRFVDCGVFIQVFW